MIAESILAAVGGGITMSGALVLWDRLWKWKKGKGYSKAKKVALREMLKGDRCDWALVESAIEEGRVRKDTSADTTRLALDYRAAKAPKKAAAKKGGAKKKAAKKKPAKKKAAKKKPAKKKAAKKKPAKKR